MRKQNWRDNWLQHVKFASAKNCFFQIFMLLLDAGEGGLHVGALGATASPSPRLDASVDSTIYVSTRWIYMGNFVVEELYNDSRIKRCVQVRSSTYKLGVDETISFSSFKLRYIFKKLIFLQHESPNYQKIL